MTNIAQQEEFTLHENAVTIFKNLAHNVELGNVELCREHFKIKSSKFFVELQKLLIKFCEYLTQMETTKKIVAKKGQPSFKKLYNTTLNMIRQRLTTGSELFNILFINADQKFISHSTEHFAQRTNLVGIAEKDFIIGSMSNENEQLHILRLSEGRCGFETLNEMLSYLLNCVENAGIDNLIVKSSKEMKIKRKDGGGSLHVEIPQTETPTTRIKKPRKNNPSETQTFYINLPFCDKTINSNSSRIKHFLFGSNWDIERIDFNPNTCLPYTKSTLYHQYNVAVYARIFQLIDMHSNNPTFEYSLVKCCRTHPTPCEVINIVKKSPTPQLVECQCHMQLCSKGCGKAYHGISECDISLDEATEQFLATHKSCPKCNAKVHKFEGCNHMTCRCKIQFCYICGQEYQKDIYNYYMVTEHHQTMCPQYS